MLYAGLDLSRKRVDVCLLDEDRERVAVTAAPTDADGLRGLARRLACTIAAEIGEIERFSGPKKLTGYTGLCPRVYHQRGDRHRRAWTKRPLFIERRWPLC